MTKKSLISLCISVGIFIALIVVATFFDLEISVALGNADSVFGQFFNIFGMTFMWIIIPFSGIVFYQALTAKFKLAVYLKIFFVLFIAIGWYLFVRDLMEKFEVSIKADYLYICVFSVILTVITILATKNVDKAIINKLVIFAVIALIAAAISGGIVELLKNMWSRLRFRNMPDGDYGGYSEWFKPHFFGKGHIGAEISDYAGASDEKMYESFPSGHAMAVGLTFLLTLIPDLFENMKKYRIWFVAIPIILTVATMLSRIIARAHFLSDVVFGAFISICAVYLVKLCVYFIWGKVKNKLIQNYNSDDINVILENKFGHKNADSFSFNVINENKEDIELQENIDLKAEEKEEKTEE